MIRCSCSWVCYMLWYSDIWIYRLFWNVGLSENGHINLFFRILLVPKCTCPLFYASYTFGICVSKCYFKLHTAMVNCLLLNTTMSDFCLIITIFGNVFLVCKGSLVCQFALEILEIKFCVFWVEWVKCENIGKKYFILFNNVGY